MFLEMIFRDGAIEFSRERVGILPNGVTITIAMDIESDGEAERQLNEMLPQLSKYANAIAKELAKIGKLTSFATRVPSAKEVNPALPPKRRRGVPQNTERDIAPEPPETG